MLASLRESSTAEQAGLDMSWHPVLHILHVATVYMRDLTGILSGHACWVHFIQEELLILVCSLFNFTQEFTMQYNTDGIMHIIVQSLDDRHDCNVWTSATYPHIAAHKFEI